MTEKLKPCPFCGCKDVISSSMNSGKNYTDYDFYFTVTCKNCLVQMSVGANLRGVPFERVEDVLEQARAKWNRRTDNAGRNDI